MHAVIIPLGRFNPPHIGHVRLIDETIRYAKTVGGNPFVFISRTVDTKKNPLTPDEKMDILQEMYPNYDIFRFPPEDCPSVLGSLKSLSKYKDVTLVTGSDRSDSVLSLARKYNCTEYEFNSIESHCVVRIPSSDVLELNISASDVRRWALNGDFDAVRRSMSRNLSDSTVRDIIDKIQTRIPSGNFIRLPKGSVKHRN